jgi:hypothetical protein
LVAELKLACTIQHGKAPKTQKIHIYMYIHLSMYVHVYALGGRVEDEAGGGVGGGVRSVPTDVLFCYCWFGWVCFLLVLL